MNTPLGLKSGIRKMKRFFGSLKYGLSWKKAEREALMLRTREDPEAVVEVWNMMEQGVVKSLAPTVFPSLKHKMTVYL